MVMCLARELEIEDLRNHSRELIAQLRDVLTAGVNVAPDPKRPNFYEVKHPGQLYYIYISPTTGKVLLIATWLHEEIHRWQMKTTVPSTQRSRKKAAYCRNSSRSEFAY